MFPIDIGIISFPDPVDPNRPVFTSRTDCPIPREWLLLAALGGLALGFVLWGRKR